MSRNKMIYILIIIGSLVTLAVTLGIQYLGDKNSEEDKTDIIRAGEKNTKKILRKETSNHEETQLKIEALKDAVKNIQNPSFNLEKKYGINEEQLEIFARNIQKFSDSKLNTGLAEFFLNNYNKAEEAYSQAIILNPKNSDAFHYRALVKFFLIEDLTINDALDINSGLSTDKLAKNEYETYDSIEADLNESIRLKPSFLSFQFLGFINLKRLEYSKAVKYYSETLKLKDNFSAGYSERGVVYARQAEICLNTGKNNKAKILSKKAISDFNKSIQIDDDIAIFYANRGTFYVVLDKDELAIADLKKAIRLNEKFAQPHFILGCYFSKKGDFENALDSYSTSIKLNTKYHEALFAEFNP